MIDEKELKPEAVVLNLEASDVTPEKEKKSFKKLASKIFTTDAVKEEIEAKPSGRGRPKKSSKFFQSKSALFVAGAVSLVALVPGVDKTFEVNGEIKSFAPTPEQMSAVLDPLLRIADRHTSISEVNPDVADVMDSLLAVVAYGFELRANMLLYKFVLEQEKVRDEQQARKSQFYSKSAIESNGPTAFSEE